jgi:hypothetical protein
VELNRLEAFRRCSKDSTNLLQVFQLPPTFKHCTSGRRPVNRSRLHPFRVGGERLWAVIWSSIRLVFAPVMARTMIDAVPKPVSHYWTQSTTRREQARVSARGRPDSFTFAKQPSATSTAFAKTRTCGIDYSSFDTHTISRAIISPLGA